MICIPTNKLYYKIRQHYTALVTSQPISHPNDLYTHFRTWLKEQGVTLVAFKFKDDLRLTDTLGVAPGYDYFQFENDQDAVMFLLKWT